MNWEKVIDVIKEKKRRASPSKNSSKANMNST
jgi:hypothetical protein